MESQLDESNTLTEESSIMSKLKQIKHDRVKNDIKYIIENYPSIALESLNQLIEYTSVEKLKEVVAVLSQKINDQQSKPTGTPQASFESGVSKVSTPKQDSSSSASADTSGEKTPTKAAGSSDKQSKSSSKWLPKPDQQTTTDNSTTSTQIRTVNAFIFILLVGVLLLNILYNGSNSD